MPKLKTKLVAIKFMVDCDISELNVRLNHKFKTDVGQRIRKARQAFFLLSSQQ